MAFELVRALPAGLYRFRGLIWAIARREIATRYRGSLFGPLWLAIPPAFMIGTYTLVLGGLMRSRLPGSTDHLGYGIYLCAGILVWTPFLECLQRGRNVFVDNANLIKKSVFPAPVLFAPVLVVAAVNFVLLATALTVFLLVVGRHPGPEFAWLLLAAALSGLLGLACGAALAVVNVFFRDVGQLADMAAQLLFWLTPIIYPITVLPPDAAAVLALNPLHPLVDMAQRAALAGEAAPPGTLVAPAMVAVACGVAAAFLYRRARADLLDRL